MDQRYPRARVDTGAVQKTLSNVWRPRNTECTQSACRQSCDDTLLLVRIKFLRVQNHIELYLDKYVTLQSPRTSSI